MVVEEGCVVVVGPRANKVGHRSSAVVIGTESGGSVCAVSWRVEGVVLV